MNTSHFPGGLIHLYCVPRGRSELRNRPVCFCIAFKYFGPSSFFRFLLEQKLLSISIYDRITWHPCMWNLFCFYLPWLKFFLSSPLLFSPPLFLSFSFLSLLPASIFSLNESDNFRREWIITPKEVIRIAGFQVPMTGKLYGMLLFLFPLHYGNF